MATRARRATAKRSSQCDVLASIAIVGTLVMGPCATAFGATTAYKCVAEGVTTYSDRPCSVGRQSTYAVDTQEPSAADRAAAEARLRADQRALAVLRRERQREEVKPASTRLQADRARQARICSRLALRAKRAEEDYDHAGPRDQLQKQIRSRRAEEDRVAVCPKR